MENWKSIAGYEGIYEVSDTGLVRSLNYNHTGKVKILKPGNAGKGYFFVNLYRDGKRKQVLVHRIVAMTFIPNPQNLETVNHKDEDKHNNSAENLEWMARADNCRYGTHDLRAGLVHRKPVLQLDKLGNVVKQFSSMSEASRQTGISDSHICGVCNGKRKTAGGFGWKYASCCGIIRT